MTNTPDSVDWALKEGANAVEFDLVYDSNGKPHRALHDPKYYCDCTCRCPV